MRFDPLRVIKQRHTRPRAIMWFGIATIGFVIMWAGGIIGTSSEWFCTVPCHTVHDDNTAAYHRSSHTNVSCIACHEPVNASPYVFTKMKIHVLPDLPATIFGYYKLPPNEESEVALEMPSEQCTQCHNMGNRPATPSEGVLIDHEAHAKQGITCTTCHNRVAHPEEDIELVLEGNRKHENWSKMDGCFRCHGQEDRPQAKSECATCHPKGFDLKPKSHQAKNWYASFGDSSGHGDAAREESATAEEASQRSAEAVKVSSGEHEKAELPKSSSVNSCYTCHERKFCDDCHKTVMPHPADFAQSHAREGYARPAVCSNCHARSETEASGLGACQACHHPASRPGTPWTRTHPQQVRSKGTGPCLSCHDKADCSRCHTKVSETL